MLLELGYDGLILLWIPESVNLTAFNGCRQRLCEDLVREFGCRWVLLTLTFMKGRGHTPSRWGWVTSRSGRLWMDGWPWWMVVGWLTKLLGDLPTCRLDLYYFAAENSALQRGVSFEPKSATYIG